MSRLTTNLIALGLLASLAACAGQEGLRVPGAPAQATHHRGGVAQPVVQPAAAVNPGDPTSLYARLGQRQGIEAVVTDFTNRMARDRRVNSGFANTDAKAFIAKLTDQICEAAGGPCKYTGKDMKAAHAGLAITDRQWNITVAHLRAAMRAKRVGGREQREVLALLGPMKKDIVSR